MRQIGRLLIYAVLAVSMPAFAAPFSELHGNVVDSNGATLQGAHLFIRADKAGGFDSANTDQTLTTDSRGHFAATLGPGYYDVCAMFDAFTPQCRKVLVHARRNAALDFTLKIDPEVEKRLGDTVQ